MKIILFRFEAEKIHLLECNINSWEITLWDKNKISLDTNISRGEKYFSILNEFKNINTKYSPDYFAYQSPMKYRGAIKDEEGYVNSALLHLFSEQNNTKLLELNSPIVRDQLWISTKDLKELLETEKNNILENYKIAKSDKLLDGLIYLSVIKTKL